jgi:hypothetical protein
MKTWIVFQKGIIPLITMAEFGALPAAIRLALMPLWLPHRLGLEQLLQRG